MESTIRDYFWAILRREPTESQLALWNSIIDPNNPEPGVDDMVDALCPQAGDVLSILRLYQVVFGRVADTSGLDYWVEVFRNIRDAHPEMTYNDALIATIPSWLGAPEFVDNFGSDLSDEDFVALLYLNILGRPPEPEGYHFWLTDLKAGLITREQLIVAFSESSEFQDMVNTEAKNILLYDAQISSDLMFDDPEHVVPGNEPYQGKLQNEAPTDIIAALAVDENTANGTPVLGDALKVLDRDAGNGHTWSLLDDADGRFALDDETAQCPRVVVIDESRLNHEAADSHIIRVRATDRAGNTIEKEIAIAVNDVNEAPENIQLSNTQIEEQDGCLSEPPPFEAVVGRLSAGDDDGDPMTYAIVASTLPGALKIEGDLVKVADPLLIDSEANVADILLTVRATDPSGKSTVQDIPIQVRAIDDECPTAVFPIEAAVAATAQAGFVITPLIAEDPDTSPDDHTFEIAQDPTNGGFAIDASGKKLVLADPRKIGSAHLIDGGPMDADGMADGFVVVPVMVRATDPGGNQHTDTIHVTVDHTGVVLPFTDTTVEVLQGSDGNDTFTANAGYGPDAPFPGFNRTANAGDIGSGEGGFDKFVLTKQDNAYEDGTSLVSGVRLNDVEAVRIVNRDRSPFEPEETLDLFKYVCTPCIETPVMAPNFDDPVIFEASLAPDIDHLAFAQSLASVGVWDLQADFWAKDPLDLNDRGPVVDVVDVTADFLWVDSDPQAKLAGTPVDEIVFNLDEVRINGLLITENASGNEPGIQRAEQIGAIRLVASGVPSVVGSINNGPGLGGVATPSITSTLTIVVPDLTGTRPAAEMGPTAAAANTAAIDFFAGHVDGIGDGLSGLEDVVIEGGGDVFMVFGNRGKDSGGEGPPLEIVDGAGSSFLFFEEWGFRGVSIDGGEGFDTVGVYRGDLNFGSDNRVTNVERVKVVEGVRQNQSLHMFDDTTQEIVFAGGISTELNLYNIPNPGGTTDQLLLCDQLGEAGFVIHIDQCCYDRDVGNDHAIPDRGDLPDLNMYLDADGEASRLDVVFNVDPGNPNFAYGPTVNARNIGVRDTSTLLLRVEDCDDETDGDFEVGHLGSQDDGLWTLLLADDGNEGTTRILQDPDQHSPGIFFEENPFRSTPNLSLINGVGGVRNQEFLRVDKGDQPPLKFLPVLEEWGDDFGTERPGELGFQTFPGRIVDELVVSDDGAVVNLGEGNDMFTGNRLTADGSPDAPGADVIKGNGGSDLIFGAAGNDQIEGGTGDDELQGEAGNDCIWGNEGDDLINGGEGSDYVDGGIGDDVIFGGFAGDVLRGGEGDDAICGDDGDDCLFGGDGNDLLIGGRGADFLDAGTSGTDVLVGDYNCDPCYVHVQVPTEIDAGDVFTVGLDRKNGDPVQIAFQVEVGGTDGAREFICVSEINLSAGGWIEVLVDGASYQSAFVGSTEATIDHFVTTWGADIAAKPSGYQMSRDGNKLVMTAAAPPDSVPVPDIAPGNINDTITNTKIEKIYEATATPEAVSGAFEMVLDEWVTGAYPTTASSGEPECWDVFATGETFTICRVGEAPGVTFGESDAPVPSVHKFELGGQIAPSDKITFEITSAPPIGPFTLVIDALDNFVPPSDDFFDTVQEFWDLAQLIADHLNANQLSGSPYSAGVDPQGNICIVGPGDDAGTNPTVALTIADGDPHDTPDLSEMQFIDLSALAGIQIGDEIAVDYEASGGAKTVSVVVAPGEGLPEIVANLVAAIDGEGAVSAKVDPNDPNRICIESDMAGAAGAFISDVAISYNEENVNEDDKATINLSGFDTPGETLTIGITTAPNPQVNYSVPFDTSETESLFEFVANHAGDISNDHQLTVSIEGGKLVFRGGPTGDFATDGISLNATIFGSGSASAAIANVTAAAGGHSVGVKQEAADATHDDTQTINDLGLVVPAEPRAEVGLNDLVSVDDKSKASQDVFVAAARNNDAATFATDGYDNDLMPRYDFRGLLEAAGLRAGANGADGGVEGVVYVLDFNQGNGRDDLSTWHLNEAYNKSENTDVGSATGTALKGAFGGDLDRVEGDKLAFRKSDGVLDDCGSAANYAESENSAANRDDADANAVNAFNANEGLRYYVNARTFEDALLKNHALIWGVDVDQADVDAARADLADGFDDNDVGGGWLGSLHLLETMRAAKSESWLRVYYNEAGTDAAPEAVMELVGLDRKTQMSFKDIVGDDCIDDCDFSKDPVDICDPLIF